MGTIIKIIQIVIAVISFFKRPETKNEKEEK